MQRIRDSLRIYYIGNNGLLQFGLEEYLEVKINGINKEPYGARGVVLVDPASCTMKEKINLLYMMRTIAIMPGWKGVSFIDKTNTISAAYTTLLGLPLVDLTFSIENIGREILNCIEKPQRLIPGSIGYLSSKQWEVISTSIDHEQDHNITKDKSYYNSRLNALNRLGIKRMSELNRIIAF